METLNCSRKIWMVDTTLRDGEQAPGVVFNTTEKLDIASALCDIGMDEIEAGIPAMGDQACKDIKQIMALNLPCMLSSWCRVDPKDIEKAISCGTPGIHISFPTSSVLLKTFDKTESWVLETLRDLVGVCKTYFDQVSVGAQDATRTRGDFLNLFAQAAFDQGVDRLRLADTVGMISPMAVMSLVKKVKQAAPMLGLEFHGHNDLGMATANAVSAVEAGADALSVTVNGLGERAGNAALEEVVMALFEIGGFTGRIRTDKIKNLCDLVTKASGITLSDSKPVIGKNVFCHESGIHCSGLLKDASSYQLFAPERVGRTKTQYVIGYHSGSASIEYAIKNLGIRIDKTTARKLLTLVRKTARQQKSFLTPSQLKDLYLGVKE